MLRKLTWMIGGSYNLPEIRILKKIQQEIPEENYLKVTPTYIYLMPSNNFTDDVNILSNVVWTIN